MEMMESCVPPGFRFHPTEEELVGYYLKRKINSLKIDLDVIVDLDLYNMEPWDIQETCKLGYNGQNEWYFFSHKDKKYPSGTRTNRATCAGFWKATGRDKAVLSKNRLIGMRKTLVFYKGRAPNGRKSDWIMHEYRLQTSQQGFSQEEGWVVCRAFKKPTPSHKQGFEAYYVNNNNGSNIRLPMDVHPNQVPNFDQTLISNQEFLSNQLIQLPKLDSPTLSTSVATKEGVQHSRSNEEYEDEMSNPSNCQFIDWKNLDNLTNTTSFYDASLPHDYDLQDQNNVSHLLELCYYQQPN